MKYDFQKIEKKWQKRWDKSKIYQAKDFSKKPKYYCLIEFPYPSGAGLHLGHLRSHIAIDIVARKKRMSGFNVLYPIGWDAFGLPTENFAIKTKTHPKIVTKNNVKNFRKQIKNYGPSFDWSREINTTDPEYYKYTQWIFLKLFNSFYDAKTDKAKPIKELKIPKNLTESEKIKYIDNYRLAYEAKMSINWCPSCKIGLANEEVVNNSCERCGTPAEKKIMKQWMLRITKYADRLIRDLDDVDYLEKIKTQQINWIGKSQGAEVEFRIKKEEIGIKVFTTRPDTLFGCTYMVVSPEHSLIKGLKSQIQNYDEVEKYIEKARNKSDLDRTDLAKEKTGIELKGIKAINPANNKEISIWVADFVLSSYGTGAIMSVPAHDERDFEFAKKYDLPINPVVIPENLKTPNHRLEAFNESERNPRCRSRTCHPTNYRIYENEKFVKSNNGIEPVEGFEPSGHGMTSPDPHHATGISMPNSLYQNNKAFVKENVFVNEGVNVNSGFLDGLKTSEAKKKIIEWLKKNNLGKKAVNYKLRDWVFSRQHYWGEPIPIIKCEKCGNVALKEKDLPLKLPNVKNYEPSDTGKSPLSKIDKWVSVKCPICNSKAKRETDTMPNWAGSSWYYLRYLDSKNKNKFADEKKIKYWMPVDLYNGGMEHTTLHLLYSRFWHKFLYDLKFVNTAEPYKARRSQGMILAEDGQKMSKSRGNVISPDSIIKEYGADTLRLYEMFIGPYDEAIPWKANGIIGIARFLQKVWKIQEKVNQKQDKKEQKLEKLFHQIIKKITQDIENLKFNTAISQLMILLNGMEKEKSIFVIHYSNFLILLSVFAPHITEELWEMLGNKKSIHLSKWPEYDKKLAKQENTILIVQVNGKVRDKIEIEQTIAENEIKDIILKREKIEKYIENKQIKKIILVKGKLVNIVI